MSVVKELYPRTLETPHRAPLDLWQALERRHGGLVGLRVRFSELAPGIIRARASSTHAIVEFDAGGRAAVHLADLDILHVEPAR